MHDATRGLQVFGDTLTRQKLNADWTWHFNCLTGRLQLACRRIDLKRDEAIGTLVCGDQELSLRVDAKASRSLAKRRLMTDIIETSVFAIDRKDREAVVASV